MKLLIISLTNKCNLNCSYCIAKRFTNTDRMPDFTPLTNERLFKFLNLLDSSEWVVELTGGEPAFYPELGELIKKKCSI